MADPTEVETPTNLYDTKPTLTYASRVGLQAAAVGAFVSTIQNALSSHSRGAMGFLTRTGGTIGFFGVCYFLVRRSKSTNGHLCFTFRDEQVPWDSRSRSPSPMSPTNDRKTTRSMAQLVLARQVSSPVFAVRFSLVYFPAWTINNTAARSLPMAIGGCVVLGAVMGTYDYAGQLAGEPALSLEEKRKKFFKPGTPIPDLPSASE